MFSSLLDAPNLLKKAGKEAFGKEVDPASLPEKIGKIIAIFLLVVGGMFFVLLLYGGYKWMMARGNPEEAKKAKEILTDALIGLIIVLAAYAVSVWVVDLVGKATV